MPAEKITIEEQELSNMYAVSITTFSREDCRRTERLVAGVPEKNIGDVIKKLEAGYEKHDRDISIRQLCKEQINELKCYNSISGELYKPSNF